MVILFIVCGILLFALFRKVNIVTEFSDGVKDGLKTVLNILPSLLLIFTAIGVLRSSGLLDLIIYIVRPLAQLIGIPEQTVPSRRRQVADVCNQPYRNSQWNGNGPCNNG